MPCFEPNAEVLICNLLRWSNHIQGYYGQIAPQLLDISDGISKIPSRGNRVENLDRELCAYEAGF